MDSTSSTALERYAHGGWRWRTVPLLWSLQAPSSDSQKPPFSMRRQDCFWMHLPLTLTMSRGLQRTHVLRHRARARWLIKRG